MPHPIDVAQAAHEYLLPNTLLLMTVWHRLPMRMAHLFSISLGLGLVVFATQGCSSSDGERAGCSTDQDCKGERVCADGACVDPEEGGGTGGTGTGGTGTGGTGGKNNSGGTSAEPQRCTRSSNDCDADCQASCGTPSCVELCCRTVQSPGVLCRGTCHAVGTIECKGACVDGTSNQNCGSCGNVCDEDNDEECRDGECKRLTCEEIGTDCLRCVARPDCGFCRSEGGTSDECRIGGDGGPTDGSSCPGNWPEDIRDGGWVRDNGSCPS